MAPVCIGLINVENLNQNALTFARPRNSLDVLPAVSNISVKDGEGNNLNYSLTPLNTNSEEKILINTQSKNKIILEYLIDLTLIQNSAYWKLDQNYGMVESQIIFYQPTDVQVGAATAKFQLPAGWQVISRLNLSGNYYQINVEDKVEYGLNKYFIWGPVLFGEWSAVERAVGNVNVRVAFTNLDPIIQNNIANSIFSVIQYGQNNIGTLTKTPSLNILYGYSSDLRINNPSSRDHILGDFRVISENFNIYPYQKDREISHTIFHTFFSHFDMDLWDTIFIDLAFGEGIIQFYALKSLEQTGIWDADKIHQELIGWYNDYLTYILGTAYDVPIYPESGTMNFPNDSLPSSYYQYGIRNILSFEKQPLIFWLLDYKIKGLTGGAKSLNDVWKYFHDNNPGSKTDPISYNQLLATCNSTIGFNFT